MFRCPLVFPEKLRTLWTRLPYDDSEPELPETRHVIQLLPDIHEGHRRSPASGPGMVLPVDSSEDGFVCSVRGHRSTGNEVGILLQELRTASVLPKRRTPHGLRGLRGWRGIFGHR